MDLDPLEEQAGELEALEAIFGEDFEVLEQPESGCNGARFQVDLTDHADADLKIRLIFTHTTNYPAEPILLVVHVLSGLSTPRRKELQTHLERIAAENLEIPAVYTICEAARDWLADKVVGKVEEEEEDQSSIKFETLDGTQRDQVEVISSKAVGTPVTVESFAEWQEKFLAEVNALKCKEQLEKEANTKVTGREFFESRNMVVSAESESFWEAEADQIAIQ